MPPMSRAPVLRTCLFASGLTAAACSVVSKVDFAECTASAECRGAFGLGWVCGSAGLCEEVVAEPRCNDVYPVDLLKNPDKYEDAIIFGSLLDHTPETGDLRMVNAASLAIEEANASGLVDGRLFGIVHCDYREDPAVDDRSSEQAAVDAAKYLVDQLGTPAIIGPGTSGLAEAVFRELQKPEHAPTLVVSPSATSDSLTNIDVRDGDKPGLFWRTAPPDSVLGKALAQRMTDEKVTSATVIFEQGSYGEGLANNVGDNFAGDVALRGFDDPSLIVDLVAEVGQGTPGEGVAVVFIGSEVGQVVDFLNAASSFPFYKDDLVTLYLGDAAYNDAVLTQTAGTDAVELYDQVRIAFPSAASGPVYTFFAARYKAMFDNDDPALASYSPHMYDATWLGIYGAAWAHFQRGGDLAGLNLAFGLQQISNQKAASVLNVNRNTWNDIKTEFKAGRAVNVEGASGNLNYDPETEELIDIATDFFGIEAGEFKNLDGA
jgi:branched-chain amino acid transport system substrate-binding protein